MSEHPLHRYARKASVSLAEIASKANTSRMTVHRVIRGENTTLGMLRRLSEATDGHVTVEDLIARPAPLPKTRGSNMGVAVS